MNDNLGSTEKSAKATEEKDTKFLFEQYQVISNNRIHHDSLFWSIPITFLTAQAFLLVIALGGFNTRPWQSAIGAFISLVFGILSIQVFDRNRVNEISDAELLLDLERHFQMQGFKSSQIHQKASNRKYLSGENVEKTLKSRGVFNFFSRGTSYELWRRGMWLVSIVSCIMFFYNLFQYFDQSFLWYASFTDFKNSLDKSAVSTLFILIAANCLIYFIELIPKNEYKFKSTDLKFLIKTFLCELLFAVDVIEYSILSYYGMLPTFLAKWSVLILLCIILLLSYMVIAYRKPKPEDAKAVGITALVLAGGKNLRLKPLRNEIVKFLSVTDKDKKSLLERTLRRNDEVVDRQIIITLIEYCERINSLEVICTAEREFCDQTPQPSNNSQELVHETGIKIETDSFDVKKKISIRVVISKIKKTLCAALDFRRSKEKTNLKLPTKKTDKDPKLTSKLDIITEPCSKGTATAIYYYIWKHQQRYIKDELDDPVILITPTDHLISDEKLYGKTIQRVCGLAMEFDNIYLLGIIPTFTSNQYGYIKVNNTSSSVLKVDAFLEKPSITKAKSLIQQGSVLWNSGIYIARKSVIENAFNMFWNYVRCFPKEYSVDISLSDIYNKIPQSSFDKDVIEKVNNLFAVPVSFDWVDVGDPQRLQSAIFDELCSIKMLN